MTKNITLTVEEDLIAKARARALEQKTSLNALFRQWLSQYVGQESAAQSYQKTMTQLKHVQSKRKFSREELNAR